MRGYIITLALTAVTASFCFAQDEYDDIYYNPKSTAKSHNGSDSKSKKKSNYIEDFGSIDVDDYNRRGFYYETPVDTIGSAAENAEDFVYTQQIQKYYNPTIVVDNSDILDDIIYNSYGNVEIIIDNGYPTFGSIYTGPYIWTPTYYNWYARPAWTWSYAWGPWTWNWTWGYSPVWTCGPSWSWGYYPGWNWGYYPGGWGYYPPRPPRPGWDRPYYGNYRPGGHRPAYPAPGWSSNTRPGGNYNGGYNRPSHGGSSLGRPGSQRPTGSRYPSGGNVSIADKVDRSHRNYGSVGSNPTTVRTDRTSGTTKRSDIGKRYSNSKYESVNTNPVGGGTVNPGSNRSIRSMRNNSTTIGTQVSTPSRTDRGSYDTRRNSSVNREQRTQSNHSTVTSTPRQESNGGAWRSNSTTTNRNSYTNRNTTTNTQRNYNTTTTNRRSYNNTNTTNSSRSYNNSTTRNSNSTYRSNSGYSRGSSSGVSRSGGSGRSGGFGRSSGGGGHRR